ncbi:unnamed protein product [Calypogeia fissa]
MVLSSCGCRTPTMSAAATRLVLPSLPNSFKGDPINWGRVRQFTSERCMRRTPTASWQELVGVVVLSAFPFTAVKALANSSLGETLQVRAKQARVAAQRDAPNAQAARNKAKKESLWYGEARPKYLGPIPFDYPQYLGGDAPGDYGYDILGLARDPANFAKYFNFEVLHARWAMLGALGAVVPELLTRYGGLDFSEPVWWRIGYAKLQGDTLDYFGIPGLHVAGAQGVLVIAFCQVLLMVGPEYARYCGIEALEPLGIYLPGDINYPGGVLFDPLGLSKDVSAMADLQVKEIKNGRLAMVAWLGFFAQAAVTGKGPVENLADFVSDPAHQNVFALISQS